MNIYFPDGNVPVVPKPTKKERAIIDACYPGWRDNPETQMDYEVNLSCIGSARAAIKALRPWFVQAKRDKEDAERYKKWVETTMKPKVPAERVPELRGQLLAVFLPWMRDGKVTIRVSDLLDTIQKLVT